jgi:hypothetical protein
MNETASLIGCLGSSAFRLSTVAVSMSLARPLFSPESAPRALPIWDPKTRWNNLARGLAVSNTAGPSGFTNSPHPSSREGDHSTTRWNSSFLLLQLFRTVLMRRRAWFEGHNNRPVSSAPTKSNMRRCAAHLDGRREEVSRQQRRFLLSSNRR